ncbi:hypothetical protein IGI04_029805 [Brassica rapa subsp. trilocularis]|uniref:Uncharacterized protein n=1 Tax=Brassica rapa subsp. trilocularis TaxID=1813537 RepID=A0ABQ7LNV7_BRACM|nr:hypothetical protein IGI04_029805 [Brassica rapa subsp. trilocularis]
MDSCRIDVSEELGRYVATELGSGSVATWRPSLVRAWSLLIDRAVCMYGSCVVTELDLSVFRSSYSNLSVDGLNTFPYPWDSLCLIQTGFGHISRHSFNQAQFVVERYSYLYFAEIWMLTSS